MYSLERTVVFTELCARCGRWYKSKGGLYQHKDKAHPVSQPGDYAYRRKQRKDSGAHLKQAEKRRIKREKVPAVPTPMVGGSIPSA